MKIDVTGKGLSIESHYFQDSPYTVTRASRIRIHVPIWIKWLVKLLAEPLINAIFDFMQHRMPEIISWLWDVAEKTAGQKLPEGIKLDTVKAVQEWLRQVRDEILSQL